MDCTRIGILLSIFWLASVFESSAQQPPAADPPRAMESLPPHLQALVDRQQQAVLPGAAGTQPELQGLYNLLNVWNPGQPLRVCFFGGTNELRARIAIAAKQWEKSTRVKLDFGNLSNPRLCEQNNQTNHIRVGFAYKGYWSLVGQKSVDLARQFEQSLNLEGFDASPPKDPEFTRLVLHEFGHALGLEHEHQNPWSGCEKEYDWPRVEAYLAGPPNYWSVEKTHFNMQRIYDDGNIRGTAFDRTSIMLYTFPAFYYIKGTSSRCFAPANFEISKVDRETVNTMYPADGAAAVQARVDAGQKLNERLSALLPDKEQRETAISNIEVLSAPITTPFQRKDALERLNAPLFK
jgi:hypothetical protein